MKKIFAVVLGLSLALGSVTVSFAQDTAKTGSKKPKKAKKAKTDTSKK